MTERFDLLRRVTFTLKLLGAACSLFAVGNGDTEGGVLADTGYVRETTARCWSCEAEGNAFLLLARCFS